VENQIPYLLLADKCNINPFAERRLSGVVRHSVFRYVAAKSKALALHIKNVIWKARAFFLTLT